MTHHCNLFPGDTQIHEYTFKKIIMTHHGVSFNDHPVKITSYNNGTAET